jgi:putative MATE family efflux protein
VSVSNTALSDRSAAPRPDLWAVTWPLLFGLALTLSLHFVDAFFLSRISDQAAAGVGALFPLIGVTLVVLSAVGQAGNSVASQLIGARRYSEVAPTYLALVVFNSLVGLGASTCFVLLHRQLPAWLGLSGPMLDHAASYLGVFGSFLFLKAIQIAYGNILNSRGQTRWIVAEALLTNVSNLVLNLAFARGALGLPRLGVPGVALATGISLALGLCFTVCVVHLKFAIRFPIATPRRDLWKRLRQILDIGVPSALEPLSYQCMQMVINALVISWGSVALAARVYVMNLVMVTTVLWAMAFGLGTQIAVAHRAGARDFEDADRQLRRAVAFGIIGNFVLSSLLVLFGHQLLSQLTSDASVQRLAASLLLIGMLVEPGRATNIVVGGALRSSGDARYTSTIAITMMWCIGLPACFLFGRTFGLGLVGVWLGFAVDEISRAFLNYRRWRRGYWRDLGIAAQPVTIELRVEERSS